MKRAPLAFASALGRAACDADCVAVESTRVAEA